MSILKNAQPGEPRNIPVPVITTTPPEQVIRELRERLELIWEVANTEYTNGRGLKGRSRWEKVLKLCRGDR